MIEKKCKHNKICVTGIHKKNIQNWNMYYNKTLSHHEWNSTMCKTLSKWLKGEAALAQWAVSKVAAWEMRSISIYM